MRRIQGRFRLTAVLFVLTFSPVALAWTQETKAPSETPSPAPTPRRGPKPGDAQRVFVLKHVSPDDMARILSVFPAAISADRSGLRVLAVSAAPAVVAAIDETIKRLDVPPPPTKSVDVTGYILECSAKSGDTVMTPAELEEVVTQLKRTFSYAGCGLGQTLFTHAASDGRPFTSSSREATGAVYILTANIQTDDSQGSAMVRFRQLSLQSIGKGGSFVGSVDIRDGQRVVLGKLGSVESGKDQILVLTAKVVD